MMTYMKKKIHRLVFNIPIDMYEKLRFVAFKRNISMSKYVLDSVLWRLHNEILEEEK